MTRWLVIAAMAMPLGACSSEDYDDRPPRARHHPDCESNLACGTCTPVVGCGWCSFGDGTGKCASSPSACGSAFRWNWEPADCPVEADTGVVPDAADASSEASTEASTDAPTEASTDAPTDVPVACSAPTTFPAGCSRTTGGSLCGSSQYSVGCHGTGKPAGCTLALTSGSSTYYCCPCN